MKRPVRWRSPYDRDILRLAVPASDPVSGFLDAYALMAAGGALDAGLALALGRVRAAGTAGVPLEAPA